MLKLISQYNHVNVINTCSWLRKQQKRTSVIFHKYKIGTLQTVFFIKETTLELSFACCVSPKKALKLSVVWYTASTKAVVEESSKLAECVGKTRSLLKKILSEGMDNCLTKLDNDPQGYLSQPLTLLEAVLQECHNTFTACFHSFYPTPALQWACLCDLLNCLDQVVSW